MPAACSRVVVDQSSYCCCSSVSTLARASAPSHWCLHFYRLNYINDFDPVSHEFKKPIYRIEPYVTKTGQLDCYKPKGTWDNPTKRNWLKYDVSDTCKHWEGQLSGMYVQ